jgi:GNAT superfamily N-acetyltransferase
MAFELVDRPPTAEEYNRLRAAVGWTVADPADAAAALAASLCAVVAVEDGRAVAMGRAVGDGRLVFYIQDLVVEPERQGRGLGAALMERLMASILSRAAPRAYIGLMAAVGKEGFYERFGFLRRPNERYGCGMIRFAPARPDDNERKG